MTDKMLEIKARLAASTPGPWLLWNGYKTLRPAESAVERIGPRPINGQYMFVGLVGAEGRDILGREADLEFVANAPADMQYLLELIDSHAGRAKQNDASNVPRASR